MVSGMLLGGYFAAVLWVGGCDRRFIDKGCFANGHLNYMIKDSNEESNLLTNSHILL